MGVITNPCLDYNQFVLVKEARDVYFGYLGKTDRFIARPDGIYSTSKEICKQFVIRYGNNDTGKATDDDAGNLQPVFLERLYLLQICIFSFIFFSTQV